MLAAMGLSPDLSVIPADALAKAAARGSRVHEAIELVLAGGDWETDLPDDERGFVEAARLFLDEFDVGASLVEEQVYCPEPVPHAVTLDLFGYIHQGQETAFVDWKTFPVKPGSGVGFQLVAAQHAVRRRKAYRDQADRARLFAVSLARTGKYSLVEFDGRMYRDRWLAALDLWGWRNEKGY